MPAYRFRQEELFAFADQVYSSENGDSRKLKFLYNQSGIDFRHSVIPDFNLAVEHRQFFPPSDDLEPFPDVEHRMRWYNNHALNLSANAILQCLEGKIELKQVTHLITVSCTGMCAPGLDLQLVEHLGLPVDVNRTSVNFMGCYAAVHAMKIGDAFCKEPGSHVLIVCTELCTLHFQKNKNQDNITSSLLFADGCAAMLMQPDSVRQGIRLLNFYSELLTEGKKDMAWDIGRSGFLMTLSAEIPRLIRQHFPAVAKRAIGKAGLNLSDIRQWCIHPGGKKILEAIRDSMNFEEDELCNSFTVLRDYGNMSSATILFVLKRMMEKPSQALFGAAFGPGLTVETFTATYD